MAYGNAKSAILNLTQWLAVHFGESGIRCNAIAPGFYAPNRIMTSYSMQMAHIQTAPERLLPEHLWDALAILKSLLVFALFLASDETASFVNGIVLPVDGGYSAYSGV